MRLLYLLFQWAKPSMQGVLKKVEGQSKAFSKLVDEVQTWIIGHHNTNIKKYPNLKYINIPLPKGPYVYQIFSVRQKSYKIAEEMIREFCPDVIYVRYPLSDPGFISFLKRIRRMNIKVVTEHQSKEAPELLSMNKHLIALSESLFGGKALELVDGLVGVTSEIVRYELNRLSVEKPFIVVPNGVDVATIPLRNPGKFDGRNAHFLVLVGQTNAWHGVDRIISGFASYDGKMQIHIHIAGNLTEDVKKLIENLPSKKRFSIHAYGFLDQQKLSFLFSLCHAGFSALALHRKKAMQSAALKVREYCARGLPFVYAGEDPDFPIDFPYAMKLPLGDEPVDFDKLTEFVRSLYEHNSPTQIAIDMRSYAFEKLDWEVKMGKVVRFIKSIKA